MNHGYYQECHAGGVVVNPIGPDKGLNRVLRGGSWFINPQLCRVAYRSSYPPAVRYDGIGFRVVLAPSLAEPASSATGME